MCVWGWGVGVWLGGTVSVSSLGCVFVAVLGTSRGKPLSQEHQVLLVTGQLGAICSGISSPARYSVPKSGMLVGHLGTKSIIGQNQCVLVQGL